MKTLSNSQELRPLLKQGQEATMTRSLEAKIRVSQQHPNRETVTVTIHLYVQRVCVDILSYNSTSLQALLDAFHLAEQSEVWDIMEGNPCS